MNCGSPIAPANDPLIMQRVGLLLAHQQEKFGQLLPVVLGAAQIVERQRDQRIERAKVAGDPAVSTSRRR